MNQIIKTLSLALVNAMMVMTFILAPIPFSGNSNIAYAADGESQGSDGNADDLVSAEEGCDEGSEDSKGNKRYKAGCEFNEDLATTDAKDHYSDGVTGIIEQFAGAAFAMIGVMLFWVPNPITAKGCPMQTVAGVTFPVVQLGSLTYLLGEVAANKEFREASKMSVDKTFQDKKDESYDRKAETKEEREKSREVSKKNKETNNKQIEAYDTLESIYGMQASGLQKKILGAGLAELAFLTALGFELSSIIGVSAECTGIVASTQATLKTQMTALATNTAIVAETASVYASVPEPTGATKAIAAACLAGATELVAYEGKLLADDGVAIALDEANLLVKEGTSSANTTFLDGAMAMLPTAVPAGALIPAVPTVAPELAEDAAASVEAETIDKSAKLVRAAILKTALVPLNACTGVGSIAYGVAEAIEVTRMLPQLCCGMPSATIPTPDIVTMGIFPHQDLGIDHNSSLTAYANNYSKKEKFYVKVLVENLLHKIAMEKLYKKFPNDPDKELRQIAKINNHIKYIMDNQDALLEESNIKKEYEELLQRTGHGSTELETFLLATMKRLKSELIIDSANANVWKGLLNIGVKAVLLYFVMGSWMKEHAFPKPKNRAWTWGIMGVVNGAIIAFNMKSKSEAEERRDRVKEEKKKFLESHVLKTKHNNQNEATGGEGAKVTREDSSQQNGGGSGIMECAVPKGDGFAPSVCPSVIPRARFRLATTRSGSTSGSIDTKALGLLSKAGFDASTTGMSSDSPSLSEATLGEVQATSSALKKRNTKLLKKYDELLEKRSKKSKGKLLSIRKSIAKMGSIFKGDPKTSGVTAAQLSKGSSLILPKISKLEKKKNTAYKPNTFPKFEMPTTPSNDFDFDLGGEGGTTIDDEGATAKTGKAEEDLSEFVVNSGEINEDENVNIFKLISNRYLMSYPVLLNEKKRREKGSN
jgi:hypothetical protein